jgi:hypothetical protein
MTDTRYKFWLDSPSELYEDKKYMDILPTSSMTRVEQLNAITRFSIYLLILLLVFRKSGSWYYFPIFLIIFTILLYKTYKYDEFGETKELYQKKNKEFMSNLDEKEHELNYDLQVGRYDSAGNLIMGSNSKKKLNNDLDFTANELDQYQKAKCRKPTKDNPFMNPPITDFSKEFSPAACNADDEDIKNEIDDTFNTDLYRDVQDLFNVKNSQRQFYTVPVTSIPNDQQGFAEWLYKQPMTCKENSEMCLRYEDLRYKR